ncbi:MAG: hypothetical protein QW051_00825 [Candidatus Aenigmatarchaeota archaeon]
MSFRHNILEGLFILSGRASAILNGVFNLQVPPPQYTIFGQNADSVTQGTPLYLYAFWVSKVELDAAWLEIKEGEKWENVSRYGSPLKLSGSYSWSNFTWNNPNYQGKVYWRIYANDTQGKINYTDEMSFEVVPKTSPPAGGGAGGGIPPKKYVSNFTLDKDFIRASIKRDESFIDYLTITNNGETPLNFSLQVEKLEKNVMIENTSFFLLPGESKRITLAFFANENLKEDVYTGRLVVKGNEIVKYVMLLLEIKPKKLLFDLYVGLKEIPYLVEPDEVVDVDIIIYNFGDLKPVDVNLYYSLRDFEGNDIILSHETFAVEEQKLLKRKIKIPQNIEKGYYLIYAKVIYDNASATSSALIKVVEKERKEIISEFVRPDYTVFILFILSILFAFLLVKTHTIVLSKKRYIEKEISIRAGGKKRLKVAFRHEGAFDEMISLSVKGMPLDWMCSITPKAIHTKVGEYAVFKLRFMVPKDAIKGKYRFNLVFKGESYEIMKPMEVVVKESRINWIKRKFLGNHKQKKIEISKIKCLHNFLFL